MDLSFPLVLHRSKCISDDFRTRI